MSVPDHPIDEPEDEVHELLDPPDDDPVLDDPVGEAA